MLDLKTFKSALEQLEEERRIPKEKILDAIEAAMAAAYKKDYGKKGQIIRAKFDLETGKTNFFQVKIVVDETIAIIAPTPEGIGNDNEYSVKEGGDERVHFNAEHHMLLEDAKKIKKGGEVNDEIIFPLESKDDYGRIAAQTAKEVIIQKKGTRVNTVTRELSEEKIDIIPWSPDPKNFVSNSLSPAKVISIEMDEKEHKAVVEVRSEEHTSELH